MKKTITILLTLLMIAAISAPVFADTEGPVTGSFQTTVPPTINSIGVYTDAALTNVAASLSPLQVYYVKVSVTDNDTITDVKNLNLKLFYTSINSQPSQSTFEANMSADAQLAAGLNMEYKGLVGDSGSETTDYTKTSMIAGSTWAISITNPTKAQVLGTSHDYVYNVTIGKVAAETVYSGSTYPKWQIAALATDGSDYTSYKVYSPSSAVYGLDMNWYGQISTPTSVNWEKIAPGMAFSDDLARESLGDITFVSNGDWINGVKVKAEDKTWNSTSGGRSVALKTAHNNAANTFSLMAGTGNSPTAYENAIGAIPENATTLSMYGGSITSESGEIADNYTLFLSLSNNITYPGTYTGAITFSIANN